MIKKCIVPSMAIVPVFALFGCNTLLYGVGVKESETPPRLIQDPARPSTLIWDDSRLFGPVPQDKRIEGEALCSKMNADGIVFKPVGYHRDARDSDGKRLPGGGFYCVKV